jgi:octaprenyl-diphosphate synthase
LEPLAAISSLGHCAAAHLDHERTAQRLEELLSLDLEWVEAEVTRTARQGEEPAAQAADHLLRVGGKRIRPLSLLLAHHCFAATDTVAREIAVVVELVHSATLLHDDVIDDGMLRRGEPAARRIWGNAISVLAGDVVLVAALQKTQEHASELMPGLLAALQALVSGEVVQLRGRSEFRPDEATYYQILRDKTASLFRFAAHSGALLAGASLADQRRLESFGENVGMAFQLVDDVLDYTSHETGKALLADLHEGKFTLPLVLATALDPRLLDDTLAIMQGDRARAVHVHERVLELGVCAEVRRRAVEHTGAAIRALSGLAASPARSLLQGVAEKLAERTT